MSSDILKVKDSKSEKKISLPSIKNQQKISVVERFQRQLSIPKNYESLLFLDPMEKAQQSIKVIKKKTGIIFDETVNAHFCLWDNNFPESPSRLASILDRCNELNLFSSCEKISNSENSSPEYIQTLHTEKLFNILKSSFLLKNNEEFEELSSNYDSIFFNSKTFEASMKSAGCTLNILKSIIQQEIHNGIAIVRPPGHHAMKNDFCGYCFTNNVALAVNFALEEMDQKRILIVDWDVHHGQGTQQFFYEDPRVLYFSIHRYEHGAYWPNLRESEFDNVGEGKGQGYNFNIPLNETGATNADYLAIFHQILLPVAYEFKPQMVVISAGYDAALGCPEGEMNVYPAFFAHMTSMLMNLAGGKVLAVLEGGYCLESLSEGVVHTLRALMGHPCPSVDNLIGNISHSVRETILNVISVQRMYWKSLAFQDTENETLIDQPALHVPKIICKHPPPPKTKYSTRNNYPEHDKEKESQFRQQLNSLKNETSLELSPHQVCLIYDEQMENHINTLDESYPECPSRTQGIMKKLAEFGILDRLYRLKSRKATLQELELVHNHKLTSLILEQLPKLNTQQKLNLEKDFDSIYFSDGTPDAALLSAGCLLQVVDSVCMKSSQSGLAVIRPPGHHAEINHPYGFCIFNNVSIAAMYAKKKYAMKRILIVDWDIHHGNGIQHVFESNPNVLYISIHLHKGGNFFPYSCEGSSEYVGSGRGEGYNINIPWNKSGMGDAEYMAAFFQIILPVAYQFNPQLVLVSAGFDAAVNDPLGGCCVTPECFGYMTRYLMSLANGRVILALEGGYNVTSISYSMTMCAKALLGDPLPPLRHLVPCQSAIDSIKEVIAIQSKFWSSLAFQATFKKIENIKSETDSKNVDNFTKGNAQSFFVDFQKEESSSVDDILGPLESLSMKDEEGAVGGIEDNCIGILSKEMYAVVPLTDCPHLVEVCPLPNKGLDAMGSCEECCSFQENWVCLTCYKVLCSRYVDEHMVYHNICFTHNIVLSYADLSVWCYACENYIENSKLKAAKNSAHISKFSTGLPS